MLDKAIGKNLVSIIVLTYNSADHILNCIRSILNQDYQNYEIIIVDNASNDETKKVLFELKIEHPKNIKIILNSKNLGYNLGNLTGIENSKGDFIAIVNPDTILDKSWLSNIISMMKRNSKVVSVSGTLLNTNGTIQSSGGLMDIYGAVEQRKSFYENDNEFFYNPGSSFIFKKNILSMIHFDPNLFTYYDDVDFSWQTRLLGYKIAYCKEAKATHQEGHSQSGLPPSKFYYIAKNRIYVCSKNYSLNRILRRVFKIIFLVGLDSIYYSYKFKSLRYFWNGMKAILWNFSIIRNLNKERNKIQKNRIVSDDHIEKLMLKKSIEFNILKNQIS